MKSDIPLVLVSNRGPVSFDRDADGGRVAKRGGGGRVTALRSLVAMHDVTGIASAMTDEDRAVAAEAGGDAIDETARDGSRYRLKLVVHDRTAYDWYYNVVANPVLCDGDGPIAEFRRWAAQFYSKPEAGVSP